MQPLALVELRAWQKGNSPVSVTGVFSVSASFALHPFNVILSHSSFGSKIEPRLLFPHISLLGTYYFVQLLLGFSSPSVNVL